MNFPTEVCGVFRPKEIHKQELGQDTEFEATVVWLWCWTVNDGVADCCAWAFRKGEESRK